AIAAGGSSADGGEPLPVEALEFAGIASAAPADRTPASGSRSPESVRVAWLPARYPDRPLVAIRYEVAWAETSGEQNFAVAETAPPGATSLVVSGLDPAKTYFFKVRAVPESGPARDANDAELSARPAFDDAPPTFAGPKSVVATGSNSARVTWDAATDDLTPAAGITYRVSWSRTDSPARNLGAVSLPGQTELEITGLPAPKTEFLFRVAAVDASGNQDANTATQSATTLDDTSAPTFGGCIAAGDATAGGALLSWQPASDDTTAESAITYDVYASQVPIPRNPDLASLAKVGTFVGGTSGRVLGLDPGTQYRFLCRATDAYGNQDGNGVVQLATTKSDGAPPTFSGLGALTRNPDIAAQLELTWPPASDDQSAADAIQYHVYLSLVSGAQNFGAPLAVVAGGSAGTTLSRDVLVAFVGANPDPSDPDNQRATNRLLYAVVRAVDEAGNEDQNTKELSVRTGVSLAEDVQPIFTANCALAACHIPGNPPQGQVLAEGFTFSNVVNVIAREGATIGEPTLLRVDGSGSTPDTRGKHYLWRKVSGQGTLTGSLMPPVASQKVLTPDEIETIGLWLDQGAKDN
ncbi:MAG: fibronectin type III domain-containing protein, partial [Deltaproteobacteria bacterium]|nr:fibronectin type III domain-containing protein [Deltaproteobacteria bacterium]